MAKGDVLFYRSHGTLLERAIVWRTGPGDIVHVEAEWEGGYAIGAHSSDGVTLHAMLPPAYRWSIDTHANAVERAAGCQFLEAAARDHDPYGYWDVLDDALPGWWPVLIEGKRAYDCSHLIAQYLVTCGLADLLGPLAMRPALATPNDLARCLGVLPSH